VGVRLWAKKVRWFGVYKSETTWISTIWDRVLRRNINIVDLEIRLELASKGIELRSVKTEKKLSVNKYGEKARRGG
jgi:hypothetical protein